MRLLISLLILLYSLQVQAQTVCTLESRKKLDDYLERLSENDFSEKSPNEINIEIAQWFLGTPYVEKTLELPGEEKLVIDLQGLDCTTFVETVITLTRLSQEDDFSFIAFEKGLEHLRYRGGINEGYPSRLHYFSDWIYENQLKGILTDITSGIGGATYPNAPSFMSENPRFYVQLSDPKNIKDIKAAETEIKTRNYFYIPKNEISQLEKGIRSGDIIAITTSISNLDIVHTGFAIEKNGRIHLLHASSKNMEVEISGKPLSDYLAGNKTQSGIIVSRLKTNLNK